MQTRGRRLHGSRESSRLSVLKQRKPKTTPKPRCAGATQAKAWAGSPRAPGWLASFESRHPAGTGQAGCGVRQAGQGRCGAQAGSSGRRLGAGGWAATKGTPSAPSVLSLSSPGLKHGHTPGPGRVPRREKPATAGVPTRAEKRALQRGKPPAPAGGGPHRGAARMRTDSRVATVASSKKMFLQESCN